MISKEDHTILQGVLKGNRKSQNQLYNKYKAELFGICLRYAKNQMSAEDILQDGFIKIFKRIGEFRSDGKLINWMRKIMVHTAIEHYRKAIKMPLVSFDQIQEFEENDSSLQDFSNLHLDDLLEAIQTLPEQLRTVFNLSIVEGYNHAEIAEMLKINESTSRAYLSLAKKKLRSFYLKKISTDFLVPSYG